MLEIQRAEVKTPQEPALESLDDIIVDVGLLMKCTNSICAPNSYTCLSHVWPPPGNRAIRKIDVPSQEKQNALNEACELVGRGQKWRVKQQKRWNFTKRTG